jgi:ribosomal protein S27E
MKARDIKCKKCGASGILRGSDYTDIEGPYYISCTQCGEETCIWAYPREAWKAWRQMNESNN